MRMYAVRHAAKTVLWSVYDEPFLQGMYQVVGARHQSGTGDMMDVLQGTRFPLEGFIEQQPQAAAALLSSDLDAALGLVLESDPVVSPPARIIYRLINTDPALAAQMVLTLHLRGQIALVAESLAYLAYDKARSDRVTGLPISLEQDGAFLRSLLEQLGQAAFKQRLGEENGFRLREVPVRWTDDPDSRVAIVKTASEDLRGIWRLRRGGVPRIASE